MQTPPAFNPLAHPVCLLQPDYTSPVIAWSGHLPFAFTIIDICRPRILVELGTHYGNSFCAFCQAVESLKSNTQCHAVDTWQEDPQAGIYGEEVIKTLKSYQEPRYGHFSKLIRSTFDNAMDGFADGSVDLLHIDGLHTYEAVKHDFDTWLPKMSAQGVILFHDTNVFEGDFGVYKLWAELSPKYPNFEFKHSHGLGVLAVGANPPDGLLALLNSTPEETDAIRTFFTQKGQFWLDKYMFDLHAKKSSTHIGQLDTIAANANAKIDELNHALAEVKMQIRHKDDKIKRIQNSFSWKITSPLRSARRILFR